MTGKQKGAEFLSDCRPLPTIHREPSRHDGAGRAGVDRHADGSASIWDSRSGGLRLWSSILLVVDEAQRLREVVLDSLDQERDASGLARHAYRSRTQFYRVFRAMIEETPVAMRRRLLLERAAWELSRTQLSVTDIGLNASYGSLEALTRAFRKAFGVSPSLYRRMGATYTHLHTTNGIHHHSGKDDTKGVGRSMDLFDIFSGQESWHTRRLLDLAKTLNDEQLDCPLKNRVKVFPWDGPDQSLRQLLDRMVQTKEAWAAALTGGDTPLFDNSPPKDRTPSAMLARLEKADRAFHSVLTDVRNRNAWEDTFVDALCEPPETFTFGGMFAHVITFNAYRRMVAIDVLRGLTTGTPF
jgi:AraC family transcriptional regulator